MISRRPSRQQAFSRGRTGIGFLAGSGAGNSRFWTRRSDRQAKARSRRRDSRNSRSRASNSHPSRLRLAVITDGTTLRAKPPSRASTPDPGHNAPSGQPASRRSPEKAQNRPAPPPHALRQALQQRLRLLPQDVAMIVELDVQDLDLAELELRDIELSHWESSKIRAKSRENGESRQNPRGPGDSSP